MIPKYYEFMYSTLQCLSDAQVRKNTEIFEWLKVHHNLTDDEMKQTVPGSQTLIATGNMGWAITYLYHAGLILREKRGYYKISELGAKEYVENKEHFISYRYIVDKYGKDSKFFSTRTKENKADEQHILNVDNIVEENTPYENAVTAIGELNDNVAMDLLERVRQMNPQRFERLVVDLMVKMGYGGSLDDAANVTQYSKDEGVDGVIKEDCLGLDMIYLQAKRWCEGNNVGRHEIQAFVGALVGKQASKGVFITTSAFTKEAIEYAKSVGVKVVLIDGMKLCSFMMKYNIGVTTKEVFEIKRIDTDYFEEE